MKITGKAKLAAVGALVLGVVGVAVAAGSPATDLTGVPSANTKSPGYAPASKLSPELAQIVVAQGSTRVENPGGGVSYYGYDDDTLNAAGQPVMISFNGSGEAHKTEPDKNTYLVFANGLTGADSAYDYGTHFLFQGHEAGSPGYITRLNLDADAAHRVTVLATKDSNGNDLATIDGSTWDPFAQRLLLTTENAGAPTYSATPGFPSTVADVSGALGRGGYEGIQNDKDGNIWIVEDIGGSNKAGGTGARQPNSFVYRYVPKSPGDLANGKFQVLQVKNAAGDPITFASQAPLASPDQVALHTYGNTFDTQWVTIHDTATDGTAPFNANTLAKAAANNGTPFKRPENGVFRPDGRFQEFYFDETGDTSNTSAENACCGGWTAVMRLTQSSPSANTGKLAMIYKGDQTHAAFDNVAFLGADLITFVEDAGDNLHRDRNALDSGFVLDVTKDYSNPANQPLRWLAEGRDASATVDADSVPAGFGKNDGDNEITGIYVSDGDPTTNGILGRKTPHPWEANSQWRVFYTQQHGDNPTYEVVRPQK
ncbi:MAG TPA: hypothetical protein VN449_04320 [Gaiellaceae bacterium]|nr:hypothetical protein [Gaiellaceae bacterium]